MVVLLLLDITVPMIIIMVEGDYIGGGIWKSLMFEQVCKKRGIGSSCHVECCVKEALCLYYQVCFGANQLDFHVVIGDSYE